MVSFVVYVKNSKLKICRRKNKLIFVPFYKTLKCVYHRVWWILGRYELGMKFQVLDS